MILRFGSSGVSCPQTALSSNRGGRLRPNFVCSRRHFVRTSCGLSDCGGSELTPSRRSQELKQT